MEGSELGVDLGTFGLQGCNAVADEVGVDASFDRSDLKSDLLVDLVELAAEAVRPVAAGGIDVAGELTPAACRPDIQRHLHELYDVDVSEGLISEVTGSIQDDVRAWQTRPLEELYVVVYLDAMQVATRDQQVVRKKAVYVAVGITLEGTRDCLGLWVEKSEGARFWTSVLILDLAAPPGDLNTRSDPYRPAVPSVLGLLRKPRRRSRVSKLRGRVLAAFVLIVLVVPLGHARGAASGALETRLGFYICPNVTTTTYPQTPDQTLPGCGPPVMSPNNTQVPPSGDSCQPPSRNTDLGAFLTTQNPLGAFVSSGTPDNCATNPPTRGRGADGAALDVSVVQRGFCPTTLTVAAREGPKAGVFFPIGTLPLGTYDVTVTHPAQTVNEAQGPVSWLGVQVTGTLRVGTEFTETDAHALVTQNAFGALLRNSFAGPGAGHLVSSKTGNTARLTGTDYYACGTINVTATVTYGKRGANGVVRLLGSGNLAGGTGNYKDIKGAFTLRGSYSTRTNRGTFILTGEATF